MIMPTAEPAVMLILASKSPRRQALLTALGLTFTVNAADVDETPLPGEAPDALVCRLCQAKAQAVAARQPRRSCWPPTRWSRSMAGCWASRPTESRRRRCCTRCEIARIRSTRRCACAHAGEQRARLAISHVTMRPYSDGEIAAYVASGDPLDKAGAYAIQHPLFSPVAGWTGCYTSIMGLPLGMAADLLREAGLPVEADVPAICAGYGGRCCLLD